MADIKCKLLVVGAGPGGYVCAIRAAGLGVDTVIIEDQAPGGTCLNVGCIPSKALIHAADEFHRLSLANTGNSFGITTAQPTLDFTQTIRWKDGIVDKLNNGVTGLLRKSGAKLINGRAEFIDGKTVRVHGADSTTSTVACENVVIATGSKAVELPTVPFGGAVISSSGALSLSDVPESLAVVGGGYIGLELGTAFAKLGTRVMVIEAAASVLPQYDTDLTKPVVKRLAELGIEVLTGTRVTSVNGNALELQRADGESQSFTAGKILVTVGRVPELQRCAVDELKLTMDGAYIAIDSRCQTSMRGVFAIGDVTGEPMLAQAEATSSLSWLPARIARGTSSVYRRFVSLIRKSSLSVCLQHKRCRLTMK